MGASQKLSTKKSVMVPASPGLVTRFTFFVVMVVGPWIDYGFVPQPNVNIRAD